MIQFLKKFDLVSEQKIILAVSGGIDSMVLLDLVSKHIKHENIIIAHCNHGFRQESDDEAIFVQKISQQLGFVFEYKKAEGLSNNELAAREFRYSFFYHLMNKYHAKAILTAHHKNDQIETFLFRLMRGAGLVGLSGMKENDEERKIMRPLLSFTRKEIETYAKLHNVTWMEDPTNSETNYDRCWIRNEIIPSIEKRKPGLTNIIFKTAQNFSEVSDYMEQEAQKWLRNQETQNFSEKQIAANVFMNQNDFLNQHIALQKEVILQLYTKFNGSRQGIREVDIKNTLKWIKGMKPGSQLPFGKVKLRNYDKFIAYTKMEETLK